MRAEKRVFMGGRERQNSPKMKPRVCYSHLCSGSGDVRGRTWSAPAGSRVSAQESEPDPPRTGRVRQEGGVSDRRRNRSSHPVKNLLQGCSTELDGDVSEETVSLCAEVPDDIGVGVGRSEELHFTFCDLYALWQDSLHCYVTVVKVAPGGRKKDKT